ncbi:hypothetical protein N7520_008164 [Penicillium odoratum]|uniref:uncharacterized protein n=1 Tax=Penicillium odoratum TaxID=1167516 RepID=UPI00254999B6|nr:uncharacterized protein N7520_008164 [Penicillium odoratum]KAJ5761008.1 hypothetical protein N7520_008164 [Penicillium odoratum]
MRASWLIASTLAAFAAADASSTVVSYFAASITADVDISKYTSIAASVYAIDRTATTYDVRCQSGVAKSLCAIDSQTPWRLIQGPETYSFSAFEKINTDGGVADVLATVACSFTHTSQSVSCDQSISFDVSYNGVSTAYSTHVPSTTIDADSVSYAPLTVTAGLQAFSAGATATAAVTVHSDAAQPMITAAPLAMAFAAAAAALF